MSDANRKNRISMLLLASLMASNLVFANDYKNNVVDVKVNKDANNSVKVTIYTDKPYTDPVVVNKKANNKYVILMPETNSSLKSTPSVSGTSGTVSNVSVNTQSVNGGKGYTKIVITSEKAITVVPKTQTAPKTASKPVAVAKSAAVKPVSSSTQTQSTSTKTQATTQKKVASQKTQQEKSNQQKIAQQKQLQAQKLAQQKAQQEKAKLAQQPKPVNVVSSQNKQPIEILEQEIKSDKNANLSSKENHDKILDKEIQDNLKIAKERQIAKKKKIKVPVQYANTGKQSVIANIKAVIKDYQTVSLWKLLLLASAITFPIVVIMIILGMDKKIHNRIDKSFKREDNRVVRDIYKPLEQQEEKSEEYSEYKEQGETPSQQTFSSFDAMLNKAEDPLPTYHEEQLQQARYEQYQQSVLQSREEIQSMQDSQSNFENDFEHEDFVPAEPEDIPSQPVEVDVQPVVQQEEVVEPEIVQEIEVVEPKESFEVQLPPQENYSPDGYLSEFSSVSDKEFFDELVLQSMAEGNADGLPEESPADEIFNFMNNEENSLDNQLTENSVEVEHTKEVEPSQTPQNDDLTMLTEVKLNDNTGLYLVNYDNFSSLVGHIKDDYFVIKKFDDVVNGGISLKPAEKLKDSTRYLVRVGKNKMVVEVSQNSMSRLIDL
jgi:hypothetical protein